MVFRCIVESKLNSEIIIREFLLPKISTSDMYLYFTKSEEDPIFCNYYDILPGNHILELAKDFDFDFENCSYSILSYSDSPPFSLSEYVNFEQIINIPIEYYGFEWPDKIFE